MSLARLQDPGTIVKQELDGDIVVLAASRSRTLIEHDLIDELRLNI